MQNQTLSNNGTVTGKLFCLCELDCTRYLCKLIGKVHRWGQVCADMYYGGGIIYLCPYGIRLSYQGGHCVDCNYTNYANAHSIKNINLPWFVYVTYFVNRKLTLHVILALNVRHVYCI